MGLYSSISVALSGIRTTQAGIDLVSRNVANASTPGYTRKVLPQQNVVAGGQGIGVRSEGAVRQVDLFLQQQLRTQNAQAGSLEVLSSFLQRVDNLFGRPEDETSIAGVLEALGDSLQDLTTDPANSAVRQSVINQASRSAELLNYLTNQVQGLRLDAENNIATAVDDVNALLQNIATVNVQISQRQDGSISTADLEDQRDLAIDKLSKLLDIRVVEQNDGSLSVFTSSGFLLADKTAQVLNFDERTSIAANSQYSTDPAQRNVGTISITSGGVEVDLIQAGAFQGGEIGGYLKLRDDILVETQAQLDELASGLALAFSEEQVNGVAATAGPASGFDIDIANVQPGNEIHLNYTVTPPGTPVNITFIAVDDPASLPLANTVTANPNDQVVGINFNQPIGDIITDINAALPAEVVASTPGANTIRFLDDGAGATSDVNGVSAVVTPAALQDAGTGLALFVDGATNKIYSNSQDGQTQKLGFAGRIQLNDAVRNDNTLLVNYQTSPATASGDNTRPLDLIRRLKENQREYHPDSGIGGAGSPFSGSVDAFARRLVTFQTGQVAEVKRDLESVSLVKNALEEKFADGTGVNVDEEMANLLVLQNAFAANARVITAIQEMFQTLLTIGR
ncbi:flagellar hook-associated protein FlgK [Tepidicaulis sp.]|uniref:flagellar hook-associated protein FlgK n=1 Tax=Tepidicaulis sp. TaxID=1920809 RepID=UPI003B5CB50A